MSRASGLTSSTARSDGPCVSSASIRAMYFSHSERELSCFDSIRFCRSAMLASSSSNGGMLTGVGAGEAGAGSGRIAAGARAAAPPIAPRRSRDRRSSG